MVNPNRAAGVCVAMHRPDAQGYNRADAYVIDDWRCYPFPHQIAYGNRPHRKAN